MKKSKLEKVLEYMVNGEKELANEMLHEHIIESAREIYADLAEEDEAIEEELELDEDEELDDDLEEGFDIADKSGDFEDDLETMEDELETEEYFGEDDEEDEEAMDDLEGEMDMDMDDGMDDMDMDGAEGDEGVEDAMVNVEDALDELRAVFADVMGDEIDGEEDMGDEVADEFDDMDVGDEEFGGGDGFEDEDLDEAATLTKVSNVTMAGDDDGKKSPLVQNKPSISDGHGKAVNFAGGADEKGGKGDTAKKMSVTGPQEQKGKMDKKVAKPSNKSEKAKSNIGS